LGSYQVTSTIGIYSLFNRFNAATRQLAGSQSWYLLIRGSAGWVKNVVRVAQLTLNRKSAMRSSLLGHRLSAEKHIGLITNVTGLLKA
jgi:hypothetical protein